MATTREIGGYRDAKLVAEDLLRKSGPIIEGYLQDYLRTQVTGFYVQAGPDLLHRFSGRKIEQEIPALRKEKPHYYADYLPEASDDQIMHEVIEAACLTPSPARLGKLYKLVGELRYNELMKQWGTDPARMLPGVRPGYAEREAAKGKSQEETTAAHRNPWHPSFHGDDATRLAEQQRIIKTGTRFAQALAKSAGVSIMGSKLRG